MGSVNLSPRTGRVALVLIVVAWLGASWWARREYLPYDVKNTDVGAFLFQARTFAGGRLWRDTPEPREFFQQWQAIVRDRSHAYYPPVHALLLAVPIRMGLDPWLLPWILSAGGLILLYFWCERLVSPAAAFLAVLSLALSPFFAANGPSLLSHSSCLFLTLLFLWSVIRWQQEGRARSAFLSGLTLGLVFANRPINAIALGMTWVPWLVWTRRNTWKNEIHSYAALVGASFIMFLLLLGYYHAVSGRWTLELFTDYWPRNRFGFGQSLGRGEPGHYFQTYANHDWNGWLANLKYSFRSLAQWWTGHVWVSLLLLLLLFFLAGKKTIQSLITHHPSLHLLFPLIAWPLLHIILYAFYFTQSTIFTGPRYLFEIIPVLALAGGWGLWRMSDSRVGRWLFPVFSVLIIWSCADFQRAFYLQNASDLPVRRQLEQTVLREARLPALVFLRSFWLGHPFPIFLNQPDLNGPILYACDRGSEDRRLADKYPERNAYILAILPLPDKKVGIELIPIYDATARKWLREPEKISAQFYLGSRFTQPIELHGEIARKLFSPRPEEIEPQ